MVKPHGQSVFSISWNGQIQKVDYHWMYKSSGAEFLADKRRSGEERKQGHKEKEVKKDSKRKEEKKVCAYARSTNVESSGIIFRSLCLQILILLVSIFLGIPSVQILLLF